MTLSLFLMYIMTKLTKQFLPPYWFQKNKTMSLLFNYIQATTKIGQHGYVYVAIKVGGYYYGCGYLTGTFTGTLLNKKRFDTFQKEFDTGQPVSIGINTKIQHIIESLSLVRFSADEITLLKYGYEYLQYIQQNNYFKERFKLLSTKSSIDYDPRLLHMVDEHDTRVYCGLPHPQTDHQIQQQAIAKEQQQKLQEDKKKHKELNNKYKNFKDFKKPTHEPFS